MLKIAVKNGNYNSDTAIATGSNEQFKMKNIYDMAGNVSEWTMESFETTGRIVRGDYYKNSGSDRPSSVRFQASQSTSVVGRGFRIALYLTIEENNWSASYDKEGTYTDKNGDKAYITEGSRVSKVLGQDTIDEGLVIKDKNENEWVWIEVPKKVFVTAKSNEDYENIEKDLKAYTIDYQNSEYSDTWYNGCGIATESEYNNLKNKMYKSLYENGGFWIGRYEIGADMNVTSKPTNENRKPISKEGFYPYNYIACPKAQELASSMNTENRDSSLMFGIQWDLTIKFIEEKKAKRQEELKVNSSSWANYKHSKFEITKGKYSTDGGINYITVSQVYTKQNTSPILLTTGITKRNMVLNIYDLAGNLFEWTLEKSNSAASPCTMRGGDFNDTESRGIVSYRHYYSDPTFSNNDIGFRVTVY